LLAPGSFTLCRWNDAAMVADNPTLNLPPNPINLWALGGPTSGTMQGGSSHLSGMRLQSQPQSVAES
jgi:hypothetical protein